LTKSHVDSRELVLELFFEFLVATEIKLAEGVFDVAEERMLLKHFSIIFNHCFNAKLCLLSFLFIFTWILSIFVVSAIGVSIHTNLEKLASLVIRSREDDSLFDHFETFSDVGISIEVHSIDS
jgi:hypothetical protein